MQYLSINIQGNIISGELLEKIREPEFKYQQATSFGVDKNTRIPDEIGNAWAVLRRQWDTFKVKLEKIDKDDSAISETRRYWVNHLLNELGYEIDVKHKTEDESLPKINSYVKNLDELPIQVEGYNQSLDKRPARGGSSAHGRMQEYLNKLDEHLYGIVTNGRYIRLLRDASRLVKLSYLEFNLEKILEEELYADFAVLYRVLHASRLPQKEGEGEESIIEEYHQDSLAAGTRIREKLSVAVEKSIIGLANGFLMHPANEELRHKLENNNLEADEYYKYLLRLIYRILFLSVIEERHLIYKEELNQEEKEHRKIYYNYYSIERHRKLADKHLFVDKYKQDLWDSLVATFRLFENEHYGKKLSIKPLAGDLFGPNSVGILSTCHLGNDAFMEMMLWLNFFKDERGQKVRVNYGDLDVEEFGSVYEGLLEYDPNISKVGDQWVFSFKQGDERGRSGSHYTPEELVKPLIKHSLEYIIHDCLAKPNDRLKLSAEEFAKIPKRRLQEKALLSISVADVACGSGHILLSAARRIALDLARVRTGDEQPDPVSMRTATRDVIRNCIYGVDLNPLAVELCKVALWLEAHNPGEPLNFLDHRIKCGNAIVGLAHKEELENGIASEAYKTLPGDDKDIAKTFRDKNNKELKSKAQIQINFEEKISQPLLNLQKAFDDFKQMPEHTPAEIEAKEKAYKKLTGGSNWWRLKNLADLQVAQFFIPKTLENKDKLVTDAHYREYLRGTRTLQDTKVAKATSESENRKFFHYFLEFPEIFSQGGFDCILGNPPYLGDKKISGNFGNNFLNYLKYYYESSKGSVDLICYFLLRIDNIIRSIGFYSLISTKTIAEGDTRLAGLSYLLSQQRQINFAVKSKLWPGKAAVVVSLLTINKNNNNIQSYLDTKLVESIDSFLSSGQKQVEPQYLFQNRGKSYQGSVILGAGFVLSKEEANNIINVDEKYNRIIMPISNGNDVANNPLQEPSSYIINFQDWEKPEIKKYPVCYNILLERVFEERQKQNREYRRKYWWRFAERQANLYKAISQQNKTLVTAKTTKHFGFAFVNTNQVLDQNLSVITSDSFSLFSILQSSIHDSWVRRYSTGMGQAPRYNTKASFETYPIFEIFSKETNEDLKIIGEKYYESREFIMVSIQLGITKTYNLFHDMLFNKDLDSIDFKVINNRNYNKYLSAEAWYLFKHIVIGKKATISFLKAITLVENLRELHKEMDESVMRAYGWQDLIHDKYRPIRNAKGEQSSKLHDFYEVSYLPENDRVRFTIHPEARKEILKRLLLLNHERFEEEAWQGLHKEKDVKAFYEQKGQPIPDGMPFSDKKTKTTYKKGGKKKSKAEEPKQGYGGLFDAKE